VDITYKELKQMILEEKKASTKAPSVLLATPESTVNSTAQINEETDGMPKIISSPSGFYVGIVSLDEETGVGVPSEKLSGYFRTKKEAIDALEEIKSSSLEE